jgi:hypothetical protein
MKAIALGLGERGNATTAFYQTFARTGVLNTEGIFSTKDDSPSDGRQYRTGRLCLFAQVGAKST